MHASTKSSSQIYIALLHLDFFFLLGFWAQAISAHGWGSSTLGTKIPPLVLAAPGLLLAGHSARKESKLGHALAITFLVVEFLFVVAQVSLIHLFGRGILDYWAMGKRITAYAALALATLLATTVVAVMCWRNFNKGLKPHLQAVRIVDCRVQLSWTAGKREGTREELRELNELSARMDID